MHQMYEVVIIGGSNAGMSAAMTLGRSLRNVLVIDNGRPCNRQTPHSHNFLTRDGVTPSFLSAVAKEQVLAYPSVQWVEDTVQRVEQLADYLLIYTINGVQVQAKKVLLATGVLDDLLPIPGFAECWGISVLHCPYCHGYEVRNQYLGIVGNGDMAMEFAQLIRQWSGKVHLLTNGPSALTASQWKELEAAAVPVSTSPLFAIRHKEGKMYQLVLKDGTILPFDAVFARVPFKQSPLVQQLGLATNEQGYIVVNAFQQTSLPNVFAAGDCTTPMRSISTAVAQGTMAGAALNKYLLA
ncbi:NAD(P)/FAD-dependent oxidoreductase [Flavihumibacter sp. CACIAM 22H1]|uniref:NAD(P)/FAD-dependent oxidoreductase n=1 Tax=Flavihumibacter sp. CACIAM 22H1 TaxID=1812911 RepID=UPI0007A8191E|nr:NAD(P)/FAD-dependent oxidoreductase [Flavihumibacter sp. CACIAM 22H1]KYP16291.1 MAG: hypothetical protein A1D16_20345 [Flavihumibacter sp. CACIAM 22H1]